MPNIIPLAQGFKITGAPQSVSQVYLESIQIAISKKSATAGMTIMICEVIGGAPDISKIVPNSQVHLESHQINGDSVRQSDSRLRHKRTNGLVSVILSNFNGSTVCLHNTFNRLTFKNKIKIENIRIWNKLALFT